MSWKATAFVKPITHYPDGTRLKAAEKLLLFVLADDHNEGRGYAWPSQKTLARNSLLSERQVRRLLDKIAGKGWPIRIDRDPRSGKAETASSRYYFLMGEDKMSSPPKRQAGKKRGEDKSAQVRTQLCPVGEDTAMSAELAVNRQFEPPLKSAEPHGGFPQGSKEVEDRRKITARGQRLAMEAKSVPRTPADRERQAYNAGVTREREEKDRIDEAIAAARKSGARSMSDLKNAVRSMAAKKAMS